MTDVVGGLRSRFIHDSLTAVLESGLTTLGWFDPGRSHQPLRFLHGPRQWSAPLAFNAIVVTTQATSMEWVELGSGLSQDAIDITADLYAESDSLGVEVSNDMRDLLRGRFPFAPFGATFPILDFRLPTPASIGYAVVDNVKVQRTTDQVPEEWSRHVFTLAVGLHDTYY